MNIIDATEFTGFSSFISVGTGATVIDVADADTDTFVAFPLLAPADVVHNRVRLSALRADVVTLKALLGVELYCTTWHKIETRSGWRYITPKELRDYARVLQRLGVDGIYWTSHKTERPRTIDPNIRIQRRWQRRVDAITAANQPYDYDPNPRIQAKWQKQVARATAHNEMVTESGEGELVRVPTKPKREPVETITPEVMELPKQPALVPTEERTGTTDEALKRLVADPTLRDPASDWVKGFEGIDWKT